MCKHYTVDQRTLKFSANYAGIENPPEQEEVTQVWPKRKGHVIIQTEKGRALASLRWGVWPFFAREKPQYLHNARDDSLLSKATWKQSVAKRRCLIPGSAYFEPGLGPEGARGEVCITLRDRPAFFMAGLWDHDPDGSGTQAFTMVTTVPNDYVARFQDRMPVILENDDALLWLGHEPLAPEMLTRLCRPCRGDMMQHTAMAPEPKPIKKSDLRTSEGELDL